MIDLPLARQSRFPEQVLRPGGHMLAGSARRVGGWTEREAASHQAEADDGARAQGRPGPLGALLDPLHRPLLLSYQQNLSLYAAPLTIYDHCMLPSETSKLCPVVRSRRHPCQRSMNEVVCRYGTEGITRRCRQMENESRCGMLSVAWIFNSQNLRSQMVRRCHLVIVEVGREVPAWQM